MAKNERRSLLLVGCDYTGLLDLVHEAICKYTAYETSCVNFYRHHNGFYYKNFGHRANNFFLKHTTCLNLKDLYFDLSVTGSFLELRQQYDVILVHRPELLNDNHLSMLRHRAGQMLAVYWDSVERFPRKLDVKRFFDQVFSYDPANCLQHGFTLLPHFYLSKYASAPQPLYDVYGLCNYDNRFPWLERIAAGLDASGISYNLKAHSGRPFQSKYLKHTGAIPYRKMLNEVQQAKAILDVQQPLQTGLSFRPFEALGLNKKLITTNPHVRDYDFYHPDNVLVVDPENVNIPAAFLQTPYRPVPAGILDKYHLKNWVSTLLPSGKSLFPVPAASGNMIYRSLNRNLSGARNKVAG